MHIQLLDMLVCPECKRKLKLTCLKKDKDNIKDGHLHCDTCCVSYQIVDYIPRFVETDKYVSSFSFEWDKHSKTQLDSASGLKVSRDQFLQRTGFKEEDVKGKTILDVGCGMGRFMEIAQKFGGNVVGVDMSYSVDQAYKNVGNLPNVDIIQADIMNLPFKEKSFDNVFSLGVLMCTNNAELAFSKISKLVKSGGKLGIWVYSNDGLKMKLYNIRAGFYRFFGTRIPQKLFYKMCYISVPLYYVHKILVLGFISRVLFPTSMEKLPEWRVLDTFDWYSPKYESKHTYKEVNFWFRKNGFGLIRYLSFPVSMNGVKK